MKTCDYGSNHCSGDPTKFAIFGFNFSLYLILLLDGFKMVILKAVETICFNVSLLGINVFIGI